MVVVSLTKYLNKRDKNGVAVKEWAYKKLDVSFATVMLTLRLGCEAYYIIVRV